MTLREKILNVMTACAVIGKDSFNDDVGYSYVSAAKLNAAVNVALRENRIICLPITKIFEVRPVEINSGTEILASVEVEITLVDVDSDEIFIIRGAGSGIDKGDKALAKAQTMAVKYAWKNTLLISDSADDPDANFNTNAYKPLGNTAAKKSNNSPFFKK